MYKALLFLLFSIASVVAVLGATPRPYPALVSDCIQDYKRCALGSGDCGTCTKSCAIQPELVSKPIQNVCTLLRDYCAFKLENPSTKCIDSNCIAYYQSCKENGPSDPSCRYCGSFCDATFCANEFKECRPNAPLPSPDAGCPINACTYYANLCKKFSLADECSFCSEACSGLCAAEASACQDKLQSN